MRQENEVVFRIESFQKAGNFMNFLDVIKGPSPLALVLEHTMKVGECVELLRPLTEAFLADNGEKIEELHRRISEREHEADVITDRIRQRLSEVYLLSVGRNDLDCFINAQDDIADSAEDYSVVLSLRKTSIPSELKDDFMEFAAQVIRVSEHFLKIAGELPILAGFSFVGEEARIALEAIGQIREEERKADKLQHEFAVHSYKIEDRLDPVTLMFLGKYCSALSIVADSAEEAAKCLGQIISKETSENPGTKAINASAGFCRPQGPIRALGHPNL